jgi:hypothetical protein
LYWRTPFSQTFGTHNFADTIRNDRYNTGGVRRFYLTNSLLFGEDQAALQVFESLPFRKNVHSQRYLSEHLYGVYGLLSRWKLQRSVRLAGLFHSIYGTSSYRPTDLEFLGKDQLIELAGPQAEALVDLYCSIDRSKLLAVAAIAESEPASIPSREGSGPDVQSVSAEQFRSLLNILYADRAEQIIHRPVVTIEDWPRLHLTHESLVLWRRSGRFLCDGALRHLHSNETHR